MPGLYFHIPFCKQACHYCNFHFSTSLARKDVMVQTLCEELRLRAGYLQDRHIGSVYFGGGTPSLLTIHDLEAIFSEISRHFVLLPEAEVTLEANPDDLNRDKLDALRQGTPINRLSIGIQSFQEADLRWMNRAHGTGEARACIEAAQAAGFHNLSIDLIYGSPSTSDEDWAENLRIFLEQGIRHLSSYCLTVEEGTALGHFVKKGKQPPVDEAKAARQFEYLVEATEAAGFEHYEISNFAQPGHRARHNSSYWTGEHYLGIGPSAHSFDGISRQWNVANNAQYLRNMTDQKPFFERELLTPAQQYNEYVMTGLRTTWGVEEARIGTFGEDFMAHFRAEAAPLLAAGQLESVGGRICVARKSRFLADGIASDLFYV